MSTQFIVIGEKAPAKAPTQFFLYLDRYTNEWKDCIEVPRTWDTIELIRRGEGDLMDLMFAYRRNERVTGVLYLGHWMDGFIES